MAKNTVLLILVDGMRHDYLNPVDSPFLHALAKQNIDAIVRETFAFELRPAFFAGLQPEECDVANMFCYNPKDSPFRSIDVSHGDRAKISTELKEEANRRGYSLVKHIGGCAEIPLELLKYFDFAEKYHTMDPGSIPRHKTLFDYLRKDGKKWLWVAYPDGPGTTEGVLNQFLSKMTGEEDFIYLHFSELDWVGHEAGPHSEKQKKTLAEIDEAIRKIFCKLNQSFAGIRSIIFGDHGQVEIKKNIDIESRLQKTGLILEKDYLYFLDSTQARFWFFNESARQKVINALSRFPEGRILTETDYEKLHFRFKHNKFGELFFVVNDGVGIFPNFFQHSNPCKGLHGYLPEVEGNWAKLIIAGCGINKKITDPVDMTSLFPTILDLLGYNKPSSLKVRSLFEQEEPKWAEEKYAASIVIPTYNRLPILKECLAAIEKQACLEKDFELIVVNDGSSDGTGDFLEEYQKNTKLNFKCFHQANAGPATARNVAIRHAKGRIIILVGDDMLMEPDFIKDHITFHQQYQPLSHACLGFIDWAQDIKKSFFMDLITSKGGGQQFCWDIVKKQDPDNVTWGVFWSSNISFKRFFSLTHGLFNGEVFKKAVWEDVELGHRLHGAGLVLHFRKDIKVYHKHAMTFHSFMERQSWVGWHSHDLAALKINIGYYPKKFEENKIYSKKILNDISKIISGLERDTKHHDADALIKIYNFGLRYAALIGYMERTGLLNESLEGSAGLLYNLALADFELYVCDGKIADLNQAIAERDGEVAGYSQTVIERDAQIAKLNQAIAERDGEVARYSQTVIERDAQIAKLNQAIAERDAQLQTERIGLKDFEIQLQMERRGAEEINVQFQREQTRVKNLEVQLQSEQAKVKDFETQLQSNRARAQELDIQLHTEQAKTNDLAIALQTEQVKATKLDAQLQAEQQKTKKLDNQLHQEIEEFREQTQKYQNEIAFLQSSLDEKKSEAIHLANELQSILNSRTFQWAVKIVSFFRSPLNSFLKAEEIKSKISPPRVSEVKKQKVLIVSHKTLSHGGQILALHIARVLRQDLHLELEVALLGKGRILADFKDLAYVHDLGHCEDTKDALQGYANWFLKCGYTKAIVSTTMSGNMIAALSAAGIESVCLIHETAEMIRMGNLLDHAKQIAQHAKAVVFSSQSVADDFTQIAVVGSKKQSVRHYGLYLRNRWRFEKQEAKAKLRGQLGLGKDVKIVLAAGDANYKKGADLFIECALKIAAKRTDIDFVWLGSWDLNAWNEIDAKLKTCPYKGRVHFIQDPSETALFCAGSDVYASTSRENLLLDEALQAFDGGVPVVAFSVAEDAALLVKKIGGLVVSSFNENEFADSICQLVDNSKLSAEFNLATQKYVSEYFSFRPYLVKLCDLLDIRFPIPKVSVIVPNYNYARYLKSRLTSILNQTVPIYEWIILDDASTDQSVHEISDWLDTTHTDACVVVNQTNSGSVFDQWRKGMSLATGDYVWIAEADDLSERDFLETVLPPLVSGKAVMSYCESQRMNTHGVIFGDNYLEWVSNLSSKKWKSSYIENGIEECRSSLAAFNTIPNVSAIVFKKDVINRVFNEHFKEISQYKVGGDWVAYIRALSYGDIAFSPRAANIHRRHSQSKMGRQNQQILLKETIAIQELVASMYMVTDNAKKKADWWRQLLMNEIEKFQEEIA